MSDLLPAAVLWDLDGTLIDSEPYWLGCENDLVAEHGGQWSHEDGLSLVGNDLLTSARILRERGSVDLPPEEIVRLLTEGVIARLRQDIIWRPGARELLTSLAALGVPNAIVTMSYRPMAQVIVDALPESVITALVTGDAVSRGKPHPDPYLLAANLLNVPPHACVAIEDSPTGAASAQAAGVPLLAVEHLVPLAGRTTGTILPSLSGVTPWDLIPLTQQGTSSRPAQA